MCAARCWTLEVRAPFARNAAVLEADVDCGIGYYEIRLDRFDADLHYPPETVFYPKGIRPEGLDTIDQWSVGFLRDGVFHTYAASARLKQAPALSTLLELPLLRGDIAVCVTDVLGVRTLWRGETVF